MENDIKKMLLNNKIKYLSVFTILVFLLVIISIVSISTGAMEIKTEDIFNIIYNKLFEIETGVAENVTAVIWDIRLPRIICACFVGMGLAVSGVIFQGILQNPLADPYTLGISTGASFGASLAIMANLNWGIYFPVTPAALLGAFSTLIFVIFITKRGDGFESSNLIIAGIIVSSILSSGVSFLKMSAGENVGAIVFWIMGSLSAKNWNDVFLIVPISTICVILSAIFAEKLDIISLGDMTADSLGVNTKRIRFTYLIIGSLITAASVSVCGVIGFIGLIVPHLLRFWITAKNRLLIPLSAIFGAVLLLFADFAARIISGGEIPVGVLTTLIGGPFFIFIFINKKN